MITTTNQWRVILNAADGITVSIGNGQIYLVLDFEDAKRFADEILRCYGVRYSR